jgi:hypothetical protein
MTGATRARVRFVLGDSEHVLTLDEAIAVRRRISSAIRQAERELAQEWIDAGEAMARRAGA